jgi:hypothetical protein
MPLVAARVRASTPTDQVVIHHKINDKAKEKAKGILAKIGSFVAHRGQLFGLGWNHDKQ